jgi:hypothetical protein
MLVQQRLLLLLLSCCHGASGLWLSCSPSMALARWLWWEMAPQTLKPGSQEQQTSSLGELAGTRLPVAGIFLFLTLATITTFGHELLQVDESRR